MLSPMASSTERDGAMTMPLRLAAKKHSHALHQEFGSLIQRLERRTAASGIGERHQVVARDPSPGAEPQTADDGLSASQTGFLLSLADTAAVGVAVEAGLVFRDRQRRSGASNKSSPSRTGSSARLAIPSSGSRAHLNSNIIDEEEASIDEMGATSSSQRASFYAGAVSPLDHLQLPADPSGISTSLARCNARHNDAIDWYNARIAAAGRSGGAQRTTAEGDTQRLLNVGGTESSEVPLRAPEEYASNVEEIFDAIATDSANRLARAQLLNRPSPDRPLPSTESRESQSGRGDVSLSTAARVVTSVARMRPTALSPLREATLQKQEGSASSPSTQQGDDALAQVALLAAKSQLADALEEIEFLKKQYEDRLDAAILNTELACKAEHVALLTQCQQLKEEAKEAHESRRMALQRVAALDEQKVSLERHLEAEQRSGATLGRQCASLQAEVDVCHAEAVEREAAAKARLDEETAARCAAEFAWQQESTGRRAAETEIAKQQGEIDQLRKTIEPLVVASEQLDGARRDLVAAEEGTRDLQKQLDAALERGNVIEQLTRDAFADVISTLEKSVAAATVLDRERRDAIATLTDENSKLNQTLSTFDTQRKLLRQLHRDLASAQEELASHRGRQQRLIKRHHELVFENIAHRLTAAKLLRPGGLFARIADLEEQNKWLTDRLTQRDPKANRRGGKGSRTRRTLLHPEDDSAEAGGAAAHESGGDNDGDDRPNGDVATQTHEDDELGEAAAWSDVDEQGDEGKGSRRRAHDPETRGTLALRQGQDLAVRAAISRYYYMCTDEHGTGIYHGGLSKAGFRVSVPEVASVAIDRTRRALSAGLSRAARSSSSAEDHRHGDGPVALCGPAAEKGRPPSGSAAVAALRRKLAAAANTAVDASPSAASLPLRDHSLAGTSTATTPTATTGAPASSRNASNSAPVDGVAATELLRPHERETLLPAEATPRRSTSPSDDRGADTVHLLQRDMHVRGSRGPPGATLRRSPYASQDELPMQHGLRLQLADQECSAYGDGRPVYVSGAPPRTSSRAESPPRPSQVPAADRSAAASFWLPTTYATLTVPKASHRVHSAPRHR